MEIVLFVHFISRPNVNPSHCNISNKAKSTSTANDANSECIKLKNIFCHKVLHSPIICLNIIRPSKTHCISSHAQQFYHYLHHFSFLRLVPSFFNNEIFFFIWPHLCIRSHLLTVVRAYNLNNNVTVIMLSKIKYLLAVSQSAKVA